MSRKTVARSLPPLATMHPGEALFAPAEIKARAIVEKLRDTARRVRQSQPIPFYAMRTVAEFFGVAMRDVAAAYKTLEREGLLICKRGSQTLVTPQAQRAQTPVRGVIGLPIWMPAFLMFCDWRAFLVELEDLLRQRHFLPSFIFYRPEEELHREFIDRLQSHRPDYILWHCPDQADYGALELLRDAGLRVVVINDRPTDLAGQRYRVLWREPLEAALADWQSRGIRQVVVPQMAGKWSATHTLGPALRATSTTATTAALHSGEDVGDYVDRLAQTPHTGVIFDNDALAAYCCRAAPTAMVTLLQRARVMVMRPLPIPATALGAATVDLLAPSWSALARQIAADFHSGEVVAATPRLIPAAWRPATQASTVAPANWFE